MKYLQSDAAAASPIAGLPAAVLFGDGDAGQPDHGPDVPDEQALGIGDGDVLDAVLERGLDLLDPRVEGLGGVVGLPDQARSFSPCPPCGPAGGRGSSSRGADGSPESGSGARLELARGDGRGRQGGPLDFLEGEVVRVSESRLFAGQHPDAHADPDRSRPSP